MFMLIIKILKDYTYLIISSCKSSDIVKTYLTTKNLLSI